MVKPTNSKRAVLEDLQRKYQGQPQVLITDSYLRLEQSIQGSITNINFNMLVNQGQQNCTEQRLAITDRFVATDMTVFIYKAGTSTTATQAEISVSTLRTYPNPSVFSGANEALNLHALYNGFAQIRVDSVVYINSLDIARFYRVPTSQQGTAVSTVATTGVLQNDGFDSLNYAFTPLTPTIQFGGKSKNEVSIQLPNPTTLSGTTSQNFAVCYFRGFLVQNGAK